MCVGAGQYVVAVRVGPIPCLTDESTATIQAPQASTKTACSQMGASAMIEPGITVPLVASAAAYAVDFAGIWSYGFSVLLRSK